jgi:hypothetical protein
MWFLYTLKFFFNFVPDFSSNGWDETQNPQNTNQTFMLTTGDYIYIKLFFLCHKKLLKFPDPCLFFFSQGFKY